MRISKTDLFTLVALVTATIYFWRVRRESSSTEPPRVPRAQPRVRSRPPPAIHRRPEPPSTVSVPPKPRPGSSSRRPPERPAPGRPSLHYRVDDGIAVVQGDVAVGTLSDPNAPATGVTALKPPRRWAEGPIAYWIQPDVENPEHVRQALGLFAGTRLRFVEYNGQADALVFEPTRGICKSYLGRIGGLQPIWVAPACGPAEIAHEIMHALGFVHEQNRADRDEHISVNEDGIEDEYRYNFEKLPSELTKISQAGPFDFTSVMIYPPWIFAKGGQTTMFPKDPDQRIVPGQMLSEGDRRRIDELFK